MIVDIQEQAFPRGIHSDADCVYYDPPYDGGWYSLIPKKDNKNKSLVVWCSNSYLSDVVRGADSSGWEYRFCVVWDTITSWYIPGRPLMRDNIITVWGDFDYNQSNDIVDDRIMRKSKLVKNTRGAYLSAEKMGSHLSTVFVKCRASMQKIHPHEKPIEIVKAVIGAVSANVIDDPFCGSGGAGIAAKLLGCSKYYGSDIDPNRCEQAISRINGCALINVGNGDKGLELYL